MPTNIKALSQAFRKERKAFIDSQVENSIISFMKKHWNMFAPDKYAFYGTIKSAEGKEANELLELFGINTVKIIKVTEAEMAHACYSMTDSSLWKKYTKLLDKMTSVTVIFMVSTSAIIISNQYALISPDKFVHKYTAAGAANDIYWCPLQDVEDRLRFY